MTEEMKEQIKENETKIYNLIDKEMDAAINVNRGMLAIFGTGTIALASLFTSIPIKIAVGVYAISNLYTFGSLFRGYKIQEKIDNLIKKNDKLKKKYVLIKNEELSRKDTKVKTLKNRRYL